MNHIPLAVTAKNEERALRACLESILEAARRAEEKLAVRFDVMVILDDCVDRTGEIARSFARVRAIESSGGIVEAQRKAAGLGPFTIFSDADIFVEPDALLHLTSAMLERPEVQVAFPVKRPLPPRRRSWLAQAVHVYNRNDGFQSPRRYFNGMLFAIRDWRIPTRAELEPRLRGLPRDRFYDFHAGMRVDDVYLSRDIWLRYGPGAIVEIPRARIRYRPPETFEGVYRYYKRILLEIERLDVLFPETQAANRSHLRSYDLRSIARASPWQRWLLLYFNLTLALCRARYAAERLYYRRFAAKECPAWEPIAESKEPVPAVGEALD